MWFILLQFSPQLYSMLKGQYDVYKADPAHFKEHTLAKLESVKNNAQYRAENVQHRGETLAENLGKADLGELGNALKSGDLGKVGQWVSGTVSTHGTEKNYFLQGMSNEQLLELEKIVGDRRMNDLLNHTRKIEANGKVVGEALPLEMLPKEMQAKAESIAAGDAEYTDLAKVRAQQAAQASNAQTETAGYRYTHREIVGSSLLDPRTYFGKENTFFTNIAKDAKGLAAEFKPQAGEGTIAAGKRAIGNADVAHGTVNLMARSMVGLSVANVVKGVGLGIFDKVTGNQEAADEHFELAKDHAGGVAKTAVMSRVVGYAAKSATKVLPFLSKGLLGRFPIIGGLITYYFGRQEISAVEDMVKNGQATQQMLENTKTAVSIQSWGNVLPFGIVGEVARDAYALYSGSRDGSENRPNFGMTGSFVQGLAGLLGFGSSPVAHTPNNPLAYSSGNAFKVPVGSTATAAVSNVQTTYVPTSAPYTPAMTGAMRPVFVGH